MVTSNVQSADTICQYYLWCALRGHMLPVACPLTGRPLGKAINVFQDATYKLASKEAYKSLYRFWRSERERLAKLAVS